MMTSQDLPLRMRQMMTSGGQRLGGGSAWRVEPNQEPIQRPHQEPIQLIVAP
jgi:hypothetical protein